MNRIGILLCFVCYSVLSFCQVLEPNYAAPPPFPDRVYIQTDSSGYFNPRLLSPFVGAGMGVLSFHGDIAGKSFLAPLQNRLSYHLSVSEYISRSFLISARALFGSLCDKEENSRNIHFKSTLRLGGLHLAYNFDAFLPKKRKVDPFVLTGIEYFEFLSKMDLFDRAGNKYYYWKNGSIMNLSETDANVANAIALSHDEIYETDMRKWNNEFFGKYSERSFAIPLGVGLNYHLSPRIDLKAGITLHCTFTDYIDGITPTNKGTEKATSGKDKFTETYFTIAIDLFRSKKKKYVGELSNDALLALAQEDTDKDGVLDFNDSCQGTPEGISVDAKGCPIDSDKDRFPDYLDKEPNSPMGALVDDEGIALSDSALAQRWRNWSDTLFAHIYTDTIINPVARFGSGYSSSKGENKSGLVHKSELVVLLDNYQEGVPPADMNKLLSVPDVKSIMQKDSSASYTTGSFGTMEDAEKRKNEMIQLGFPNARVMLLNKNGNLNDPNTSNLSEIKASTTAPLASVDLKEFVFRVQLGAYSKKLSNSIFNNAGQIIQVKTEDQLYKYMSGSHTTVQDAMKHRDALVKKGYVGAFVVAYKNGVRIPLSKTNANTFINKNENIEEPKKPITAIDKKLISFKIQIGSYLNSPPDELMNKYRTLPELSIKKSQAGNNQYFTGNFHNYEEAKNFCNKVTSTHGIKDAFMVAFFKEEIIPITEALELLK